MRLHGHDLTNNYDKESDEKTRHSLLENVPLDVSLFRHFFSAVLLLEAAATEPIWTELCRLHRRSAELICDVDTAVGPT